MISTSFEMETTKEHDAAEWRRLWVWAGLGAALGAAISPVLLLIFAPLGLCAGAVIMALKGKKQTIVTTLESDGVTLWAFNERRPDVRHEGRARLFMVPLENVGRCESGNALELFGSNIQLGVASALAERAHRHLKASGAVEVFQKIDQDDRQNATAIFVNTKDALALVWAGVTPKAAVFSVINKINGFLAEARALRGASAAASATAPTIAVRGAGWVGLHHPTKPRFTWADGVPFKVFALAIGVDEAKIKGKYEGADWPFYSLAEVEKITSEGPLVMLHPVGAAPFPIARAEDAAGLAASIQAATRGHIPPAPPSTSAAGFDL